MENKLGRLTLNVLLSFAQFEREVIGERSDSPLDEIAAWIPMRSHQDGELNPFSRPPWVIRRAGFRVRQKESDRALPTNPAPMWRPAANYFAARAFRVPVVFASFAAEP
jgi:hypothetical protein